MSKLVEHVQHTNTVCIVPYGDKKFSILSIMTLSILAELLHSARHVVQSTIFKKNYVECHYSYCRFAKCHGILSFKSDHY